MVKSTSYLIDEQFDLLNNEVKRTVKRKRVHNILTEQLASLESERNSKSLKDNLKQNTETSSNTEVDESQHKSRPDQALPKVIKKADNSEKLQLNQSKEEVKKEVGIKKLEKQPKVVKKAQNKEAKKEKLIDKNFIQLLTGEKTTIQSENNTTLKIREQICKSHVMKSLGGYKFLENNQNDNFVVAILPKIENSKVVSKY